MPAQRFPIISFDPRTGHDRRPKAHFVSSEINVCASTPISTAQIASEAKMVGLVQTSAYDLHARRIDNDAPIACRHQMRPAPGWKAPFAANLHEWGLFNFLINLREWKTKCPAVAFRRLGLSRSIRRQDRRRNWDCRLDQSMSQSGQVRQRCGKRLKTPRPTLQAHRAPAWRRQPIPASA